MEEISAQELFNRLKSGENILVIDVREPYEHEENNIDGARNIPMAELPQHLGELESHKSEEVVVHCRSGDRSSTICKFMEMNGFSNVKHLSGGIEAYEKLQK